MKKILLLLTLITLAASQAFGQLQIRTRGDKISDFKTRTTKVVLSSDEALSSSIRNAVKNFWTVTPYELCTQDEFEALRSNEEYYFLAVTTIKEEGLRYWYLVKGGGPRSGDVSSMLTVISLPICPADGLSGREEALLPALVVAMQKAIENNFKGIGNVVSSPKKTAGMPLYIAEEELSPTIKESTKSLCVKKNIQIVESAVSDEVFTLGENAAVAFTVGPLVPEAGKSFFIYLIDASTFELYYFKKHKIKTAQAYGILNEDIRAFFKGR